LLLALCRSFHCGLRKGELGLDILNFLLTVRHGKRTANTFIQRGKAILRIGIAR